MRGEEIRHGIDVFPTLSEEEKEQKERTGEEVQSLGKSRKAATLAVGETAVSRVLNSTPIMVLPPLILVRLQETQWLKRRSRMVLPVNLGTLASFCESDTSFCQSLERRCQFSREVANDRIRSHTRNIHLRSASRAGRVSSTTGCAGEEFGG